MKNETKAWLMLIGLSIVWGSSFILMEKSMHPVKGIDAFTPYQVGALRILIASLVLLPIALKHLKKLKSKDFPFFLIVGLSGNFIPAFLFPIAETGIQSSLAGLLNMGVSLFIVILSFLFFKTKISKIQLIGFLTGGVGLFLIVSNQVNLSENSLIHAGIAFVATFFYAISLSTIKFKLSHQKPLVITSLAFFTMLIPSLVACYYTGDFVAVLNDEVIKGLPYLILLSIVGTALAVLVFNYLIAISTPLFASSVTYLIPIVALIFGVAYGEKFQLINFIWMILIFIGVYLMGKKPRA